MPQPYSPQEDSLMLSEQVKKHAKGVILDVGTGRGIQVLSALENKLSKKIIGIDIDKEAVDYCRKKIKSKKADFFQSDLFDIFKRKKLLPKEFFSCQFDTIIFNPPYLPAENPKDIDIQLEGGKKGYEVIERFLSEANEFLSQDGIILLLFSSRTNKEYIDNLIQKSLFISEILDKKHFFFEDLFVYKISKSEILKEIESNGISKIKFLAKGHHGLVYLGVYRGRKTAIKIKNPKSHAINTIAKEAYWLEKLEKYKIAPKLIISSGNFLAMEFVEGDLILDYIRKSGKKETIELLNKIFEQLIILDKLGIKKEEMHHPIKHIIIRRGNPVLIDFERAHYTEKQSNVTQFYSFLMRITALLAVKGIEIDKDSVMEACREYRKTGRISMDFFASNHPA